MKRFVPEIVRRACEFAVVAHGDQMYGEKPYYYHLRAVVSTMQAFSIWDKELLAAGYLHDVLEDTDCVKDDLVDMFGQRIADIADACTDGEGANRAERKKRPYLLIPNVPGAVTVKIADRLANVMANYVEGNDGLLKMYRGEHVKFRQLYLCIEEGDMATFAMARTLNNQLQQGA